MCNVGAQRPSGWSPRKAAKHGEIPMWCNFSARAIATDIRSCRNMERSRRCRRRCAAPELGCSLGSIRKGDATKQWARLGETPVVGVVVVVAVVVMKNL